MLVKDFKKRIHLKELKKLISKDETDFSSYRYKKAENEKVDFSDELHII